jgi:hypothetical protein
VSSCEGSQAFRSATKNANPGNHFSGSPEWFPGCPETLRGVSGQTDRRMSKYRFCSVLKLSSLPKDDILRRSGNRGVPRWLNDGKRFAP